MDQQNNDLLSPTVVETVGINLKTFVIGEFPLCIRMRSDAVALGCGGNEKSDKCRKPHMRPSRIFAYAESRRGSGDMWEDSLNWVRHCRH